LKCQHKKKQYYVNLVKDHSTVSSIPNQDVNQSILITPVRNPPIPQNLRTSPLTPNLPLNNVNKLQSPIEEKSSYKDSSSHLLTTPVISRTKKDENFMREEILKMFEDGDDSDTTPYGNTTKGLNSGEKSDGSANSNKSNYKGEKVIILMKNYHL